MLTLRKRTFYRLAPFRHAGRALRARLPWHEQRESEAKRQALSHPRYALEAWFDEGVFVGLSGCWQFAGYGYIEHLAIDDTLRSAAMVNSCWRRS